MTEFTDQIIDRVKQTIARFNLLDKTDKVCVDLSGGKDSLTALYILHKLGYDVSALCIDEGIEKYRRKTLDNAISFCKAHHISYKLVSFEEEFGHRMPYFLKGTDLPCTVCGTLRRYLLNKHSKGFDKIATGHNLDDEAQAIMMNLFRANIDLMPRLGPKSRKQKGFTQKIKPLYFVLEKETTEFVKEVRIATCGCKCPYVRFAYRKQIRELLDEYEEKNPGTKKNIVERFIKILPKLQKETFGYGYCKKCGEPSKTESCKVCRIVDKRTDPVEILQKYYDKDSETYKILMFHNKMVLKKAQELAKKVKHLDPDTEFIKEAVMLHDIGIFKVNAPEIFCYGKNPYVLHGYFGRQILEKEGLHRHALLTERHVGAGLSKEYIIKNEIPLPKRDAIPESIEEIIVCFADRFYSKSGKYFKKERPLKEIRKFLLERRGQESLKRLGSWCRLFGMK